MSITIYTWAFYAQHLGDRDRWADHYSGHAAIKIKTDVGSSYFSWWPCRDRTVEPVDRYVETLYDSDKVKMRISAQEPTHPADGKYRFSDEVMKCCDIKSYLNEIVNRQYRTSVFAAPGAFCAKTQNCSAVVAWALRRGGCEKYASWPGYFVWHPNNLAHYCEIIAESAINQVGAEHVQIVRSMPTASPAPGAVWLAKKKFGFG